MTKKRQQDFAKVHLKPGRSLKRNTLPSVKFKSRKLVMPKERVVKKKSEYTITDCTRKLKNAGNEKDKCNYLNELNKLIHRQSDSLTTELNNIFETVVDFIRDSHDDVRNNALKIILYVLENVEDSHLRYYSNHLNKHIFTIMKNPSPKIASASLVLLDCMVKNHPDLICHNMDILGSLLPTEKPHFTRQPTFEKGIFLYSESEEVNNLGHMNTFLKSMLENKSNLTKVEEDKDVYMDKNHEMSLILYTSGGLKPIDIEELYSKQFNPKVDHICQAAKLNHLINELVPLIPDIFNRIIRCQSREDDHSLRCDSIKDLSIIAEILCRMVEIAEKNSNTIALEEIATLIKEKVYLQYKKRFPFDLLLVLPGTSLEPLAMLNISLFFLFMKFLFSNDNTDPGWELIRKYLSKFFAVDKTYSSEIKCKCIPLFIKMIQLFYFKRSVPNVIFFLLEQLVFLLKTRINHPNKKKLINFLYDMSVKPGYEFWFESEPMEKWFGWLLSHLKENVYRLDRKLMKMICKISKFRYPSFLKYLDFSVIKSLLKHRNDDSKETAIILLHNMEINDETFKNVYDIISLDSFPRKFAVTLISMLNARFHQSSVAEKIYVKYVEFLLNTAIGTYNISRSRFVNLEDNRYAKAVHVIQLGHKLTIVPSLYWKEHSKLFEVCLSYLRNLPTAPVALLYVRLVNEILTGRSIIPIHCVLAILKFDKELKLVCEITDKRYRHLMVNLHFSCLMTTSILTQTVIEEEWFKWNIYELMDSMSLTPKTAKRVLSLLLEGDFIEKENLNGFIVYVILRILKVFIEKQILDYDNTNTAEQVLSILTSLANESTDETVKYQPLYLQLYNFFMKKL